jgi:hypothetical protein
MNGSCGECPIGLGLDSTGGCTAGCPVDLTVDWSAAPFDQTIDAFSAPGDPCPDTFIVEVINPVAAQDFSFVEFSYIESPPPGLTCQDFTLFTQVQEVSGIAFPETVVSSGEDCGGIDPGDDFELCGGPCIFGEAQGTIQVFGAESTDVFRITADVGSMNTRVKIGHGIVVK